uniref:ABC transporter ALT5 n=1 Tax=Alternaria alternata TaxID=5599 RepID=ALT5_ALTAL|nr:RecName: Full=ABC transporter ALT5; AltName: Full=AAL-toxin biosynthesis cluster protein 5 [Alternaria alternata]BBG74265.1 ABC transporter [Alternaria alternata]
MDFAKCIGDEFFGPVVDGCRGGFDFTLKFELLFFATIPPAIFLILAVPRIASLYSEPTIVAWRSWLYASKQILGFVNLVLQVTLLVMTTQGTAQFKLSGLFLSARIVTTSSTLLSVIVCHYEHSRCRRPSTILDVYLGLTLFLDIAHNRTLWLSVSSSLDAIFVRFHTTTVACKAVLAILESLSKKRLFVLHNRTTQSLDGTRGSYSLSTFSWLSRLLLSGYQNPLRLDSLPLLDEAMAVETLYARFLENTKGYLGESSGSDQKSRLPLSQALAKTLLLPLLLPILPRLVLIGLSISQAFLIQAVTGFLSAKNKADEVGYGLIGATILIYVGIALSTSLYWYYHQRFLYMARSCLTSGIFRKTTELSEATLAESQAITLMSTDIERVLAGFLNLHELWASLIQAVIVSWILWTRLKGFFALPVGLTVACFVALATVGRYIGGFQKTWMQETQKRVAMIASVLASMKQVKVSGLAATIDKKVQQARKTELRASHGVRMLQITAMTLSLLPELIAPVITLAATSESVATSNIFTIVALISLLTAPLGQLFQSVAPLMSGLACLDRIQTYLELEPVRERRGHNKSRLERIVDGPASSDEDYSYAFRVVNGSFRWQKDSPHCLQNVNLTVKHAAFTMIVGPVGSGKSTLCKALLGEISLSAGRVLVGKESEGKIAYCGQTPFLSNSTIRDNIVHFSQWNTSRYIEVIEASGLSYHLARLPDGHDTLVGSNGLLLSGGQRQLIAIARALYSDAHTLIFDDVLSGLDARTEDHVFRHIFGPSGLLRKRHDRPAVILCTQSVMYLPLADHIIVLSEQGDIAEQGKWEVLNSNGGYLQSLCVRDADATTPKVELGVEGESERNHWHTTESDEMRTKETLEQQLVVSENDEATVSGPASSGPSHVVAWSGGLANYRYYLKAVSVVALVAFLASAICYGFFFAFPTLWLNFWVRDATSKHRSHTNAFWVGIYGLFHALSLLGGFLTMYLAVTSISLVSGASLHSSIFAAIMRAPLSLFRTIDQGTLTNYFSQDITLVDGELPRSLIQFVCDLAISLSMAGVLAASSPYLAAMYPIAIALMYATVKLYLRTSRQLRILALEAKSPLYMHFLDVGRGIATLRAARLLKQYENQNDQLLEISQRPAYLLAMVQYWLLFILNIIVMFLAIFVVTLVTQLRNHGTGFAGSGLVMLLQFGQILASAMQSYAKLETSMGAVHRLKSLFEHVVSDTVGEKGISPPLSWPSKGYIKLDGVSASYMSTNEETDNTLGGLALRNIRLVVEPGQHVAICGRSGSGKSSLVLLLLGLLEPLQSTGCDAITIDGLDIRTIKQAVLSERIIAVSQDTIFLPAGASWQENLDLLGTCTTSEVKSVLENMNLWSLIESQDGGLTAAMKPEELSSGQKQLFSVARAVLRKRVKDREIRQASSIEIPSTSQLRLASDAQECKKTESDCEAVEGDSDLYCLPQLEPSNDTRLAAGREDVLGGVLLLDEFNSSMDLLTEQRYFNRIQSEFPGYTIIAITHSLASFIKDQECRQEGEAQVYRGGFFDRIIVLDSGMIVEDGHPTTLLETSHSKFRALCEAAARGEVST